MPEQNARPPRENLIRAMSHEANLRDTGVADSAPTLFGHFARFNSWTRINSVWEGGPFMERIAPGAFKKTFADQRDSMRVLFNHGHDPQIGDKPLGSIRELREDDEGAYYEVDLLDTPYVRQDILPGLKADLYGASFRFTVVRDDEVRHPKVSDYNPDGIPERTIRECRVPEFGPVTFPAYKDATAGARSLTDEFLLGAFRRDPVRLRALLDTVTTSAVSFAGVDVPRATDEETEERSPLGLGDITPKPEGDVPEPQQVEPAAEPVAEAAETEAAPTPPAETPEPKRSTKIHAIKPAAPRPSLTPLRKP